MKIKKTYLLLLGILILALFFRTYKAVEGFAFAHDGDLYSWMVRDVVVNHHFRLVGQETSTSGVYIGPLYYYLLIPFYLLNKMDPIGALQMVTLVGLITVFSYFFVFKKLYGETAGFIAAFIQAVNPLRLVADRWPVPTNLVNIWAIWYFYAIFSLVRGNYYLGFPLIGLMVGLIWHIHIALAPLVILIPLAIFFAKKMPTFKNILGAAIAFTIPSVPLFLFEVKHNFIQVKGFIASFSLKEMNVYGNSKLDDVIRESFGVNIFIPIILLCLIFILFKVKKINWKEMVLMFVWPISIILFFTFSSKLISEYYFEAIKTVGLGAVALCLATLYEKNKLGKVLAGILLLIIFTQGLSFLKDLKDNNNGYLVRKNIAKYIIDDSKQRGYPCVAVSYITKPGENVGYRYFFWLNNLHVNQSNSGSPDYTIVYPTSLSPDSIKYASGAMGVIPPQTNYNKEEIDYSCSGMDSNVTDPFFGFTE